MLTCTRHLDQIVCLIVQTMPIEKRELDRNELLTYGHIHAHFLIKTVKIDEIQRTVSIIALW